MTRRPPSSTLFPSTPLFRSRARHFPVVGPELREDIRTLEVLPRVPERPFARLARGCGGFRAKRRRQVVSPDHLAGGHDYQGFHHLAELAHVPRPVVGDEGAQPLPPDGLEPLDGLPP